MDIFKIGLALAIIAIVILVININNKGKDVVTQRETDIERTENMKDIYLAGGCFWGIEEYMDRIEGVVLAESGYANGNTKNPTYEEVCSGTTNHAETVHVIYDEQILSLEEILEYYYKVVDPVSVNKQGNDVGSQYRTGIYYVDESNLHIIESSLKNLQKQYDAELAIEVKPLTAFYRAEEYHQDYLKKHPNGYCHIDLGKADEEIPFLKEEGIVIDESKYSVPSDDEIRKMLTDSQYEVAINNGTERAFDNEYYDNKDQGIYVDIVTGVPLFSSKDKYDSGTGWPSFTKPIAPNVIKHIEGILDSRTEVRSNLGDIHLGHVFNDGPMDKGGLRYCMNSNSLLFIPLYEMEERGYRYLLN